MTFIARVAHLRAVVRADATLMSALTYASAPWAIGTLWRSLRGRAGAAEAYVAACAWLFSASWCYDGYLLLRDGSYPLTWVPNLAASSVLYVAAGMLWNLHWRAERGVVLAFTESRWPPAEAAGLARLIGYAIPLMLLAAAMILPFVL